MCQFVRWQPIIWLWCLLYLNLSIHWLSNPNYKFGWLVPIVGVYAMCERWRTRPLAEKEETKYFLDGGVGKFRVFAYLAIYAAKP